MTPHPPTPTLFPYTTLFRSTEGFGRRLTSLNRSSSVLKITAALSPRLVWVLRPCCRSEEHTSELQSHSDLVCRLLLEKKMTCSANISVNYLSTTLYLKKASA